MEPLTRGDPTSPLRWTCKSRAKQVAAWQAQGWRVEQRARRPRDDVEDLVEAGGVTAIRVGHVLAGALRIEIAKQPDLAVMAGGRDAPQRVEVLRATPRNSMPRRAPA